MLKYFFILTYLYIPVFDRMESTDFLKSLSRKANVFTTLYIINENKYLK